MSREIVHEQDAVMAQDYGEVNKEATNTVNSQIPEIKTNRDHDFIRLNIVDN